MSSSNTSVASTIADIQQMTINFVKCYSAFLFAVGVVGHTLNVYVFTRRALRSNSCARYFLAMAVAGYLVVFGILPLRLLQIAFKVDVFVSSILMCQILSYILGVIRVLPSWFIVLSCADRFLCSSKSAFLRGWSSARVASRAICLTVFFISLSYIHMPIKYVVTASPKSCTGEPGIYSTFLSIWHLVIWSWIPTISMLVFGFFIIQHIREGKTRVTTQNIQNSQNQAQQTQRKTDRQLIQMMLIQAFVFGSTTTIYSFVNFYISLNPAADSVGRAQQNFLGSTFSYIALTGPCISFYLFTLSSQLFRRELKQLFRCGRQTQVANTIRVTGVTRGN